MALCQYDEATLACNVCGHVAATFRTLRTCTAETYEPRLAAGGPGTELAKLLKRFGIEPTPTCQCRAKAAEMDAWGPDECERPERIDEVVAVMRAEAAARGLPFLDSVGRILVRRAIRNARRSA